MSAVFVRSYSNLASRHRCTLMSCFFPTAKRNRGRRLAVKSGENVGLFFKNRVYPGGFKKNHNMCLVGRISLLTGFDTMDFWKRWQACERSFSIQICKVLDGFRQAGLKYYPVDFKQAGWKEKRFEWVTVWEKKTRGLRREKTQMKWRSVWHKWVSAVASFSTPSFPLLFRTDFWSISFLSPVHTTLKKRRSKNHPNQMTL